MLKITMAMTGIMFVGLITLCANYASAADEALDEVVSGCEESCGNFPGAQFNECFQQCVEAGGPGESDWEPEIDCDECYECKCVGECTYDNMTCEFQHTDTCVENCLVDGEDIYGDWE